MAIVASLHRGMEVVLHGGKFADLAAAPRVPWHPCPRGHAIPSPESELQELVPL